MNFKRFFSGNWIYYFATVLFALSAGTLKAQNSGIKPNAENPYYWEYNRQPVLLLGGSSNDNLFQNTDVVSELDKLKVVGGNYVRCTLSGRDVGDEWPFWRAGLRYNLNKFNPEFWQKLDYFFKLTAEREIIVQVEIWAIHDFVESWNRNPWNPVLNNVFTEENTRLKQAGFDNSLNAKHDFFFSVPNLNNDSLLLYYQNLFVDQLLSVSLKYKHILYCVTNEIYTQYSPEWGWYWAGYLKRKAAEQGLKINITEMYQNHDVTHEQHDAVRNYPELFSFIDISQNSRKTNEDHWNKLQKVKELTKENPRPINNIKIYGGAQGEWTDGPEHGIERFWRNIIGGAASVRFNRPPSGIGFSERAQKHIKSARMLENEYDFFTSKPDVNFSLLKEREKDEAYLASNSAKDVLVYFPDGGEVVADFTDFAGTYKIKWLNTEGANWYAETEFTGGKNVELKTPHFGAWIALIKKIR